MAENDAAPSPAVAALAAWRVRLGARARVAAIRCRVWLTALPGVASRHRLFCATLGAGLVLRLIVMAAFRPAILVRQDSFDYMWDAVHLTPDPVRPDGYAFFLAAARPLHSLALIAGLQHLMGLAIAVMVYALLANRGVPGWGATLAAAPVIAPVFSTARRDTPVPSCFPCLSPAICPPTLRGGLGA